MGNITKIEWTDYVWNPVTGCSKVSAGCTNCYAERDFHRPYPGRDFTDVRTHPERLNWPLRWRGSKQAKAEGRPSRIFVNSMSDLFHDSVPPQFIDSCFAVMALAGNHTFQILTKRPERMRNYFDLSFVSDLPLAKISAEARIAECAWNIADMRGEDTSGAYWDLFLEQPYANVWLGVSVEDQKTADERIPLLLQTPAAVRFVSYEPALGEIYFSPYIRKSPPIDGMPWTSVDWVIAGGESGPHARPSHPDWFYSVRDQCQAAGVPFFFKHWGEYKPVDTLRAEGKQILLGGPDGKTNAIMEKFGKKWAGRKLDGREWNEFPK